MQALLAEHTYLATGGDEELLLVRREQTIGDGETSQARWSIDHLFVTKEAVPVLVEVKRATDTRLRREVIGQLLDYAANGSVHWNDGMLKRSFEEHCQQQDEDPQESLQLFAPSEDYEAFWEQVDANLRAGRMRLVVVADTIPAELERIILFLDEQMSADVKGIELNWFEGENDKTTLVPRVIDSTATTRRKRSAVQRPPIEAEAWLDAVIGEGTAEREGVDRTISAVEDAGGSWFITRAQKSKMSRVTTGNGNPCYPISITGAPDAIRLNLQYLKTHEPFHDEEMRAEIRDRLEAIVGPLSKDTISGHPGFAAALLSDDHRYERFRQFASELVQLLKHPGTA
jgi:hypothetical protein